MICTNLKKSSDYEVYFFNNKVDEDFSVLVDLKKVNQFQVFNKRNTTESNVIVYVNTKEVTNALFELWGGELCALVANKATLNINFFDVNDQQLENFILGVGVGVYQFDKYFKEKFNKSDIELNIVNEVLDFDNILKSAKIKYEAINMARTLVNEPSNMLKPSTYEQFILERYQNNAEVTIDVFKDQALIDMELNGLYHVGKGSSDKGRMIVLSYQSNKDLPLTALVGKGLTFDTGGMNLKTSPYVGNMKNDMGGSASMLGAFDTIVNLKASINLKCYLPICENAISQEMQFAGDIINYPNGISVEVGNTDAEGRLVLADALLLAQKDGATTILDAATLTGAMVAALGDQYAGVFSNDEELVSGLVASSKLVNENIWHMPIIKEYEQFLKSDHADYMNIALNAPGAGASTAASFLNLFIDNDKVSWLHLDIAGTAYVKKLNYMQFATGFGIKTITNYLLK